MVDSGKKKKNLIALSCIKMQHLFARALSHFSSNATWIFVSPNPATAPIHKYNDMTHCLNWEAYFVEEIMCSISSFQQSLCI